MCWFAHRVMYAPAPDDPLFRGRIRRNAPMTNQDPEPSRPAGTVYGRGGVNVREPRSGRSASIHPAVTALAVIAAIVAVLALGYWIWRTPADLPEHTAPAAAPAASSQSATPSP